jgi:hypothetical protein
MVVPDISSFSRIGHDAVEKACFSSIRQLSLIRA